jgi:hypothetical protein
MEQTAVEWLVSQMKDDRFLSAFEEEIEKAKEIEKQQIIEAHFEGVKETVLNLSKYIDITKTLNTIQEIENCIVKHEEGEDYYNKTFKNK